MKGILLTLTLINSLVTFAGFEQAPPSFKLEDKNLVWVDFQSAEYQIVYDTNIRRASAISTISFIQHEEGYPLFDSVTTPSMILVNGEKTTSIEVKTPGEISNVRMIGEKLSAGHHTLTIKSRIENGVKFKTPRFRKKYKRVSSAFFIRDLTDRMFLEKYLPTNLEYDNYKMIMDVEVVGTKRWHSLFANGEITKFNNNHYRVEFPDYYTSSSVFFHIVPINKLVRWYLKYTSIDGRKIPVTIYSKYRFYNHFVKKKAWKVMKELEADYGPWPHDKLIIYGTGLRGGMEYAGATETSIVSLGHELQHSYFAKGIHPANGNSGWMDEAIASWRDKGHQSLEKPFYESANLGNHSPYTRKTDKRSYEYGRSFMSYLDHQLKEAGHIGLKDFLRIYFQKRKHTSVTTQDFVSDLEEYAAMSFDEDFRQYIFGEAQQLKSARSTPVHIDSKILENPHHPKMTQQDLDSIL